MNQTSQTVQIGLRLPKPLYDAIVQQAKNNHRGMGDQMRMLSHRGFTQIYGYDPMAEGESAKQWSGSCNT